MNLWQIMELALLLSNSSSIISYLPAIEPEKPKKQKTSFLDSLEDKFHLELGSTVKVRGRRELRRQWPQVTSIVVEMYGFSGIVPVECLKYRFR